MSTVSIKQRGITNIGTEIIVNAANSRLQWGGGVCGVIFNAAGGRQLQKECDVIGYCPTGSAVLTGAYKLEEKGAKYIVHAVGPMWNGGHSGEAKQLYGAYKKSLELAMNKGCGSIGFPLISAGIYGYPKEEAWSVALNAIFDFFSENKGYNIDVLFAVPGDIEYKIGHEIMERKKPKMAEEKNTETRPYVPWKLVNDFMIDVFEKYGVSREDAAICADVLLESDRRGVESHGCNRFKPIYLDRIKNGTLKPVTEIEIVKETPTTVVIDAHDGMGMVASHKMMEMLIEKAKTYGMAGGAIMNSTHYGIAGYWTGMAAKAGMIGISGTNARPSVAPTFGVEPMMGTNPLTFTMPTDEEFPFNFDCATSTIQNGKIEFYERQGKETPAGLVVNNQGETVTDSGKILKDLRTGNAALLPLGGLGEATGGYKGYGFTTIVEILSAALCGGPFMKALNGRGPNGEPQMYHLGHFFFVINPEFFMGLETFKETAGGICRSLRASRKAPGAERIYTAGEKEYMAWLDRKDKGVPVGESIQKEFIQLRDELKLDYRFPFE